MNAKQREKCEKKFLCPHAKLTSESPNDERAFFSRTLEGKMCLEQLVSTDNDDERQQQERTYGKEFVILLKERKMFYAPAGLDVIVKFPSC